VTRLLKEIPGDNMNTKNLQEYYGRISWPDNSVNNSEAYLTMLVSFDYASKMI